MGACNCSGTCIGPRAESMPGNGAYHSSILPDHDLIGMAAKMGPHGMGEGVPSAFRDPDLTIPGSGRPPSYGFPRQPVVPGAGLGPMDPFPNMKIADVPDLDSEKFRRILDEIKGSSVPLSEYFDMDALHRAANYLGLSDDCFEPTGTSGERLADAFGPHTDEEEGPVADVLALEVRAAIAEHEDNHEDALGPDTFGNVLETYNELLNYYREQLDAAETSANYAAAAEEKAQERLFELQRYHQEGIDEGGKDHTVNQVWAVDPMLDFGGLGDCHSTQAPDQDKFDSFDEDERPDAVLNPHDIIDLAREIFAKRVAFDTTRWGYSLTDAVNEAREAIAAAND